MKSLHRAGGVAYLQPQPAAAIEIIPKMVLKCAPVALRAAPVGLQSGPKVALAWYATPEHRTWRATVLARAHGHCQGPNCGRFGVRLFADHIREISDGGAPLDPDNGQALCGSCHSRKTWAMAKTRRGRQAQPGAPGGGPRGV